MSPDEGLEDCELLKRVHDFLDRTGEVLIDLMDKSGLDKPGWNRGELKEILTDLRKRFGSRLDLKPEDIGDDDPFGFGVTYCAEDWK